MEAEKRKYELNPVAGEEMEKLAKEVMSQPAAIIDRMKKVLGNWIVVLVWPTAAGVLARR